MVAPEIKKHLTACDDRYSLFTLFLGHTRPDDDRLFIIGFDGPGYAHGRFFWMKKDGGENEEGRTPRHTRA